MGPIWGRQDPGGPPVGPMNFGIWAAVLMHLSAAALEICNVRNIHTCLVTYTGACIVRQM